MRPTILMIVRLGPSALAVGAGEGCLDSFNLIYLFLLLFGKQPEIENEILSQRPILFQNNQPINFSAEQILMF